MTPNRTAPPRVGMFGLLGQGNLGNDGSLEAVLAFLRARHPDAEIDFMCSGTETVTRRYGLPAVRLNWNRREYETIDGAGALAAKAVGKVFDAFRIAAWVRRHDVVIVPGMGVLESVPPIRPWGLPYSLFLLGAAGKVQGRSVALISVGADRSGSAATRWLVGHAARMAAFRSFRDAPARAALQAMGVDTAGDAVYPDLVFSLPRPDAPSEPTGVVGLGVMDYHGGDADRARADEVYADYLAAITRFAHWLIDSGFRVRVLIGDHADVAAADALVAGVRADRPDLDDATITAAAPSSLGAVQEEIAQVDTVVATRFHNIICALGQAKPTISLGYAAKNDVLMQSFGLGEFCQPLGSLDIDRLIEQFTQLQARSGEIVPRMRAEAASNAQKLEEQFTLLSRTVIGESHPNAGQRSLGGRTPDPLTVMGTTIGHSRPDHDDSS